MVTRRCVVKHRFVAAELAACWRRTKVLLGMSEIAWKLSLVVSGAGAERVHHSRELSGRDGADRKARLAG
jgi:hypothetical protein